jgi:uncharacterized protein
MSLASIAFALITAPQTQPAAKPAEEQRVFRHIPDRKHQLKELKKAKVTIDGQKFNLWVMDSYSKRQEGMMFVENTDFKDDEGMIFLFKNPDYQRFWMMNTLVPLDIAYVGTDNRILNTYTMRALDTVTDYSSWGRSGIVIEVRAGLFRKLGIGQKDLVELPKDLKALD